MMVADRNEIARHGAVMLDRAVVDPRQEFGSFFLSRFLGLEIVCADDRCTVCFDVVPPMLNPRGTLHGGIIATAIDVSMGHLMQHVLEGGTTVELKVQYLAPVTEGRLTCSASFLRKGRSISFLQSTASGANGDVVAHATATWVLLKGK